MPEYLKEKKLILPETNEEYQKFFKEIRREFSLTRRTLRWFRQLPVLYNSWKLVMKYMKEYEKVKGTKDGNPWYVFLRAFNGFLAAVFFTLDHIFWAYLAKLHRNQKLVNKVGDIADWIYITQSIMTICTNSIEMHYMQQEALQLRDQLTKKYPQHVAHSKHAQNLPEAATPTQNATSTTTQDSAPTLQAEKPQEQKDLERRLHQISEQISEMPAESIKNFTDLIVDFCCNARLLSSSSIIRDLRNLLSVWSGLLEAPLVVTGIGSCTIMPLLGRRIKCDRREVDKVETL